MYIARNTVFYEEHCPEIEFILLVLRWYYTPFWSNIAQYQRCTKSDLNFGITFLSKHKKAWDFMRLKICVSLSINIDLDQWQKNSQTILNLKQAALIFPFIIL